MNICEVWCCRVVALALLLCAAPALAIDYSLTGFGTLGYARSDQKFEYLRHIDDGGTLKVDSLIGLQGDVRFDPQWNAGIQIVSSASRMRDDGTETRIRWAFVGYRPDNDWLFRFGRLRPPVLFNTQLSEVGMTYEQVRVPQEVYSLSPVFDLDGVAFTRIWSLESSDVSLDGYFGDSKIKLRRPYQRDYLQTDNLGQYLPQKLKFMGLVLSRSAGQWQIRGGVHQAITQANLINGIEVFFDPVPLTIPAAPPLGGTLYLPGPTVKSLVTTAITIGVDWHSGHWHVSGEYGERSIKDFISGLASKSAHVTIERKIDQLTPYVSYARLLSPSRTRRLYRDIDSTPVPLGAQGAPFFLPANFHRILADGTFVYDQHSLTIGTSYAISPSARLKIEWMRTKVGLRSAFVDGDVHRKSFNVYSMAYNFAF